MAEVDCQPYEITCEIYKRLLGSIVFRHKGSLTVKYYRVILCIAD